MLLYPVKHYALKNQTMKKITILIGILVGLTAIFIAYSAQGKRILKAALNAESGKYTVGMFVIH